jgi:oxygen-independent coproporphyrinogen-3 oxidase
MPATERASAPAAAPESALPPLSLYVHLPWCVRKCPYCDFNSYETRGDLPERAYVSALLRDLDAEADHARDRPLQSVFIGGGTPSLFSGTAIRALLDGIRARVAVALDVEVTLEANPGAAETSRFAAFRDAGVNRLSIGIQSLRDRQLAALGRVHDAATALAAVELARRAGFDNFNLDLMYALPGDDADGALADLAAALEQNPAHLSWYQLTLEPNTAFERKPPALPPDEDVAAIERRGRALLAEHGFERYEVSAYALPGRRCRHNLNYWEFGDYLGLGAGAHGKRTLHPEFAIERRAKTRNPRTYLASAGTPAAVTVERIAGSAQIALEYLMNALRLLDGVDVAAFEQRTGRTVAALGAQLAAARERGWLRADSARLRTTPQGLEMLNRILELFA